MANEAHAACIRGILGMWYSGNTRYCHTVDPPIFVPWYILLPALLCQATNTSIAVYGLLVNLHELHLQTHGIGWLIVFAQIALGPIFAGLEGTAILWGLFTLKRVQFHVVKK